MRVAQIEFALAQEHSHTELWWTPYSPSPMAGGQCEPEHYMNAYQQTTAMLPLTFYLAICSSVCQDRPGEWAAMAQLVPETYLPVLSVTCRRGGCRLPLIDLHLSLSQYLATRKMCPPSCPVVCTEAGNQSASRPIIMAPIQRNIIVYCSCDRFNLSFDFPAPIVTRDFISPVNGLYKGRIC